MAWRVHIGLLWLGPALVVLTVFYLLWYYWLGGIIAPGLLNAAKKPPIYTRSECLVRTDISEFDDSGEIDFSLFLMRAIGHLNLPVASVGFNGEDLNDMYVLFTERCDQKFEMAQSIADTFEETYPESGKLVVAKDRVEIGEDTIRHEGPEWIDGLPWRESK